MKHPLDHLLRPELLAAKKRQAERAVKLDARRKAASTRPEKRNGRPR